MGRRHHVRQHRPGLRRVNHHCHRRWLCTRIAQKHPSAELHSGSCLKSTSRLSQTYITTVKDGGFPRCTKSSPTVFHIPAIPGIDTNFAAPGGNFIPDYPATFTGLRTGLHSQTSLLIRPCLNCNLL
jgi:hypothetical protein